MKLNLSLTHLSFLSNTRLTIVHWSNNSDYDLKKYTWVTIIISIHPMPCYWTFSLFPVHTVNTICDRNTKSFHLVANLRKIHKNVSQITYNGIFHTTPNEIKEAAVSFYSNLFSKPCSKRAKLGLADYKKLSLERANWLERDVSMEEVIEAVWDCDVTKSPGLEGFNFKFYRKAWSLICHDIMDLVLSFSE